METGSKAHQPFLIADNSGLISLTDRKRGKRPQVVRVERVVVQDGGRAIVGNLTAGEAKGGGACNRTSRRTPPTACPTGARRWRNRLHAAEPGRGARLRAVVRRC